MKRQNKKSAGKNAPPNPIRLLLVSDVHFGALAVSPEFGLVATRHPIPAAVSMKDHMVETVSSGPRPQALIVLGDLTSIGSPSEFKGGVAAIQDIAKRTGIDEQMVVFTFGNHDVDWRVCALATSTERFAKDLHYNEIGARVGDVFVRNPPDFQQGPLPGSGVFEHPDFKLFVLNSGYFCFSEQDYRHGKLGKDQLSWFEAALGKSDSSGQWRIVMVHHHPFNYPYPTLAKDISTLEEGAEFVDLVGRHGVDFVCHGHRHHPKLSTQQQNSWQKPVTFFCAGSLAVNETERYSGQIPNLFHIVSLESRLPNGGAYGNVQTFEYAASEGWRAIRNSKETPLDPTQHFGALATTAQLKDMAEAIIRNEVSKPQQSSSIMLPAFVNLPPELKCRALKELNEIVKEGSLKIGWRIIGAYPEDVVLMPR